MRGPERNAATVDIRLAEGRFGSPRSRARNEFVDDQRPIVQHRGVEIGAIRPHERVDFRIQPHLGEELRILEGAVQLTSQYWSEIDPLLRPVGKFNAQRVRAHALE